jgi:HAE1 family hydrophobic/amphiphilic exporter-1
MKPFIQNYPDYIMKFGGEYEDTEKSIASLLQSFGLAIFLIYIIITCTFKSFIQPFMLMFTIPLAVIGVFVGLIVMRTPIGMMSFMGIIALSGIVVNDSIVLIDFINRRVAEGGERIAAIVDAAKTRLRPIMLTSITTILGLMPLALGIFGKEKMLTPMAISIVWGLSFSSILTLLIIPCLYAIVDDIKNSRWKKS